MAHLTLAQISAGHLGLAYYALGRIPEGIRYYEQALANAREIGNRYGETGWLAGLAQALPAQGDLAAALSNAQESLRVAQEIHNPDRISNAGTPLALIHTGAGYFAAALTAAETTCADNCPLNNAAAHALRGIAAWRLGQAATAREAFHAACAAAHAVPGHSALYGQLDALSLAYCGLILAEPEQRAAHLRAVRTAFGAARAITDAPSIVADRQRRLDLLEVGFSPG